MQRFDNIKPETLGTLTEFAKRRQIDPFFVIDSLNSVSTMVQTNMADIGGIISKQIGRAHV